MEVARLVNEKHMSKLDNACIGSFFSHLKTEKFASHLDFCELQLEELAGLVGSTHLPILCKGY